MLEDLKSYNR